MCLVGDLKVEGGGGMGGMSNMSFIKCVVCVCVCAVYYKQKAHDMNTKVSCVFSSHSFSLHTHQKQAYRAEGDKSCVCPTTVAIGNHSTAELT